MNVTTALSSMNTIPEMGWMITTVIFFASLLTIFLLSKNFRQFIYGAFVSGILLLNYKLSRWIGVSTMENNLNPLKWFGFIFGFVIVSIILGRLLQKTKFVKNLEKEFEEANNETKN